MEDLISQIKSEGFPIVTILESFTDKEFCQIKFKSGVNSYIACFKNNTLITII